MEIASLICNNFIGMELGYPGAHYGAESDYLKPETSFGFYNVSCPLGYFSTVSCSYSIDDQSNGCDANGGPALVTCVNG